MANLGEESDSSESESEFLLAMRREKASDDDDDTDNSEGELRERLVRTDRRVGAGYDGLGLYSDDDDDDAVSYVEELEKETAEAQVFEDVEAEAEEEEAFEEQKCEERNYDEKEFPEEVKQKKEEDEKASPVNPRIGAFYMHDDRFGDSSGRSRRKTLDEKSRKFKDEKKWMHDKFEEMELQHQYGNPYNHQIRSTSENHHQGHHRNRGGGYVNANRYKPHQNFNNQNYSPKVVRGRGPIKYKPIMRSSGVNPGAKNKQSENPQGVTSNARSARVFSIKNNQYSKPLGMTSRTDSSRIFSARNKKTEEFMEQQILNTDSMFNSSRPSNYDTETQKKDVQGGTFGRFPTSLPKDNVSQSKPKDNVSQSNKLPHGKITANPTELSSMRWPTYMVESPQMMDHRDLFFSTSLAHQFSPTSNQVGRVYPLAQHPVVRQVPVKSPILSSSSLFTQQLGHCSGSGSETQSEAFSPNPYDPGVFSETHFDRNFTAAAAAPFPGMQHWSQRNDDLGDPAVVMAVTGYISQSQNGYGNPEMTRLPSFSASAGAVGAADRSPNVTAGDGRLLSRFTRTRYSKMNINN